jgi:chromosome segregation ATPase
VERKRGRIRRVKYWKTALAILAVLSTSLAVADDFKTTNGKEYKNATVTRVEPDGIVVKSKSGISKVYFVELPKEVQDRFHYNPEKAAAYSAEQNAAYEQIQKQQEAATQQTTETTRRNNEQLAQGQALLQQNAAQRENAQALQARLEQLQLEEDNLRQRIREAEQLPAFLHGQSGKKHYSYPNPAREYIPDWENRLNEVRHEKDQVKRQLEQAQH